MNGPWVAVIQVAVVLAMLVLTAVFVPKQAGKNLSDSLLTLLGKQLADAVSLAAKEAVSSVTGTLVGGGTGKQIASSYGPLSWLPRWQQASGLLPDGNPDPEQYNDCGETCVAAVVASVHGVCLEPGAIRQMLGGPARSGLTTGDDLVVALKRCNTLAVSYADDVSIAWQLVQSAEKQAFPTIVLGEWSPPDALHWVLVTGLSAGGITVANPWDGKIYPISWETFVRLYRGTVVEVQAHCHYDMSSVPTPGT